MEPVPPSHGLSATMCRTPMIQGRQRTRSTREVDRRPRLHPGIKLSDFRRYYWWKTELAELAGKLGLARSGSKPELCALIERRLQGRLEPSAPARPVARGPRDSERALRRSTPVVRYFSDARTRAFFESEIGPEFHFTYHLNQFRLAREGLTYGDLVDEWLAERDRRRRPGYRAKIADHGKYNRFIRDFFADPSNAGKSLRAAAAAWNAVKHQPGDQRYRRGQRKAAR